jgi:hypothetical protein
MRRIPVPILIGLLMSVVTIIIGLTISAHPTAVFAVLFCIFWIAMYSSEYKLPFVNFLVVSVLLWVGHGIFLLFLALAKSFLAP